MKKLLSVFVGLLCSVAVFAQTDFQELSLEEACKKAKTENKPIFLDCYTSWCGPCKMMANEVFTLKEAGDYFNKNFVCVKTDMEKGGGPAIGKQYGVDAYPTFLIINANGKLMHKVVGAMPLEKLIESVEIGLKASSLAEYEALYQAGKLDLTEQMAYWKLLSVSGDVVKAQSVGDNLWGKLTEKDKLSAAYWPLLQSRATSLESEELKFVCANRGHFEKEIGKEEVGDLIYNSFMSELNLMIVYQLPAKKYDKIPGIRDLLENNDVPRKDALFKMIDLAEARGKYDATGFMDALDTNLDVLNDSEKSWVFEGANLFISMFKDKAQLKRLGEIAIREKELIRDEVAKSKVTKIAFNFRRAGNDGVYWENLKTLREVLAQAEVEDKYVFLDCHNNGQTTKAIDDQLFTQKEVEDLLNKFFINYRVNLEEGEGAKVIRRYGINIPNVMLVLDKEGNVRHMISNVMNGNFIERVQETFDDNKAFGVLEARYVSGDRSPEFMVQYLTALSKVANSSKMALVAVELFASLNDEQRTSPEFWMLYNPQFSGISSEMKNYLFSHLQEFREKIGTEKVDQTVVNQIYSDLSSVLYTQGSRYTVDDINNIIQFIKRHDIQDSQQLLCIANITKLFKSKVRSVKDYKKACKGLKPENIPFADLYANILAVEPERTDEWNAWGKEIVESLTDPGYIQWYKQFLQL